MEYQGGQLMMTYLWLPGGRVKHGYHPRWSFVTDEEGRPYSSSDRDRCAEMREKLGWKVAGTWCITRQPPKLWEIARST